MERRRSTPLSVVLPVILLGLFAMPLLAATGSIEGTVSDAATALPLTGVSVTIYDSGGAWVTSRNTDALGAFSIPSLPTGTFYARTYNSLGYIDERYNTGVCLNCSMTGGTPISVTDGAATTGINFALDRGGRVSGRVTDAATGLPLANVTVQLGNAGSSYLVTGYTDASGNYTTAGVPTGNYSARTSNSANYINELWDNVRCLNCVPTTFPIAVTAPSTTANIDFALDRGVQVTGHVIDAATLAPLTNVQVSLVNAVGYTYAYGYTDATGAYTAAAVSDGTYYVRTNNSVGYVDQLYNDVPCLTWSCSTASATPVTLSGTATQTVNFALHAGGRVSGTVTDAVTGLPLAGITIQVANSSGTYVSDAVTDASGAYMTRRGVPAGSYYLQTYNASGYINEAYNNVPCAGTCARTAGDPVSVGSSGTVTGINFALDRGGRISGRVTDAATGQGLSNINVNILTGSGSSAAYGYTDAAGYYTSNYGLPTGTYYARTSNFSGYLEKIYDNVACLSCSVTAGTAIPVTSGTTTGGINFALDRGGRISGRVTDIVTGTPLASVSVQILNAAGSYVTYAYSDSDGAFITASGLPSGSYYLHTSNSIGYLAEAYDHVPCVPGCSSTAGTPVATTVGTTTSGINIRLTAGGRVEGTLVSTATAAPIADAYVYIEDASGTSVSSGQTDPLGHYRSAAGIPTGTYYARTAAGSGFIDERYDNVKCVSGCSVTLGTTFSVTLGATTSGINFALDPGGIITGTVRDATTSLPLAGVNVTASTAGLSRNGVTDSLGVYVIGGLTAGNYTVRSRNSIGYLDVLYNGIPCYAGCSTDSGTPINVVAGTSVSGINLNLVRGGRVSGLVTDAGTGLPLAGVTVRLVTASGATVATGRSDTSGVYTTGAGIPTGSYYARTSNANGYIDELYDNLPCAGSCTLTLGTPITVSAGSTTGGINFALAAGGRVAGTVTDASTSAPISDVGVDLVDASGRYVTTGYTDAAGHFVTSGGLPAGTYFAATYNDSGYVDELYANKSCPAEMCSIVAGTPIVVAAGATTTGIDFSLDRGGRIAGRVIDGTTLKPLPSISVYIYDASGLILTSGYTDIEGNYTADSGLPTGTYFARTTNGTGYINRMYDGLAWSGGTNITTGTPIAVTAGSTTTGINFLLTVGGRIAGTVTNVSTAAPISAITVYVYDSAGNVVASGGTDSSGHYLTRNGLPAGTYYARTLNGQGYVNRLYNGLPCNGDCATAAGTPIPLTVGTTTSGIDFSIAMGARITGRVTRSGTGAPLPNIGVNLYDSAGTLVSSAVTDLSGNYVSSNGVPTGSYYAMTLNSQGFVNTIYNGIACSSSCTPASGTAIALTAGSIAPAINFVLTADTDPDLDGIASTIDRKVTNGADESTKSSNDFNDTPLGGTTSGTLTSRGGWNVKVNDVTPDGVDMSISGSGTSAATASVCSAGNAEGVLLDASGEAARITCSATGSTTVRALVATPVLQLRKPVTGAGTVVDLSTGQSATLGSPVVASRDNTQPIVVRFVDDSGATFGSLRLDPGESVDANVSSGMVDLTVVTGTVTATINGTTTTLQEGQRQTFGSPATALEQLSARVDQLLASGDIRNKGIATAIEASLDAARKQLGKSNPSAKNELQALLQKLDTYLSNGQITQAAYDALAPYVRAVLATLG